MVSITIFNGELTWTLHPWKVSTLVTRCRAIVDRLKRRFQVNQESCAICLESLADSLILITPCRHNFHAKCLQECIEKNCSKCPVCRAKLDVSFSLRKRDLAEVGTYHAVKALGRKVHGMPPIKDGNTREIPAKVKSELKATLDAAAYKMTQKMCREMTKAELEVRFAERSARVAEAKAHKAIEKAQYTVDMARRVVERLRLLENALQDESFLEQHLASVREKKAASTYSSFKLSQ